MKYFENGAASEGGQPDLRVAAAQVRTVLLSLVGSGGANPRLHRAAVHHGKQTD